VTEAASGRPIDRSRLEATQSPRTHPSADGLSRQDSIHINPLGPRGLLACPDDVIPLAGARPHSVVVTHGRSPSPRCRPTTSYPPTTRSPSLQRRRRRRGPPCLRPRRGQGSPRRNSPRRRPTPHQWGAADGSKAPTRSRAPPASAAHRQAMGRREALAAAARA
jgi:hypothetical protein